MKKIIVLLSIALVTALGIVTCVQAQQYQEAMVQYKHNLSGKIIATNYDLEKPSITVKYTKSDDYAGPQEKEMTLRIDENTRISDASGKVIAKEALKSGLGVDVIYRIKWTFDRKPLWKIAEVITVKAGPNHPDDKK